MKSTTHRQFLKKIYTSPLKTIVLENVCLQKLTSFGMSSYAGLLFFPETIEQIQSILTESYEFGILPKILGGGTNLIITKQIVPVVICTKKLKRIEISDNYVYAQCGVMLPVLVKKAIQQSLSLEKLAGIPGSVGGALYGNSGAKPQGFVSSIGDYVHRVTSISTAGNIVTKNRSDVSFSYRNSNLQSEFIVDVQLKADLQESSILLEKWRNIFKSKFAAQPYNAKSAGCIFKNTTQKAAWQLIQEVGLANAKKGDIFVSPKHANFIINGGDGTADDFKYLINLIQQRVQDEFGIALVLEVQIW